MRLPLPDHILPRCIASIYDYMGSRHEGRSIAQYEKRRASVFARLADPTHHVLFLPKLAKSWVVFKILPYHLRIVSQF